MEKKIQFGFSQNKIADTEKKSTKALFYPYEPSAKADGNEGRGEIKNLNLKSNLMSFVKIWVPLVFSTKNREPLLSKSIRHQVQKHIISNCKEKEIFPQEINGYTEHLHCLISLGKEQTISKISQLIKGESSFWINEKKLTAEKFMWQDDYFAVSVSESQVKRVISYIKNQEAHHAKRSFEEEADEFMTKYEWVNPKQ